jgi:DNA polymerase III epsilon subunit-like protein
VTDQPICFIDTETTSLRHDRRAWEIALILRRPGKPDHETAWLVDYADLDLGNADPASLKFGRFYDRHPGPGTTLFEESEVLQRVEQLTRGAILMGSNPGFDAEVLGARMRAHGICPSWHYRTECLSTAMKWWLIARGHPLPAGEKSDALSRVVGVDPDGFERHTALGDCRWTRAIHDTLAGSR